MPSNYLRANRVQVQYAGGDGKLAIPHLHVEYGYQQVDSPFLRVGLGYLQNVYYQLVKPKLVSPKLYIQYIVRSPEVNMSTEVFPASAAPGVYTGTSGEMQLRGASYSTLATPTFKNKVSEHSGGGETRTGYWAYPKWDFSLSFDWLPNTTKATNTDFKTLCGFFLQMNGSFDSFLFRAPDDHRVEDEVLYVCDGVSVEYDLYRKMGTYAEPIGQWDPDNTTIWLHGPKDFVVDPTTYTITLPAGYGDIDFVASGVTHLNRNDTEAPANTSRYRVTGNTIEFYPDRASQTMRVFYKRELTYGVEYVVSAPRTIVFTDAPLASNEIIGTYEFFFVVRFADDSLEFEQFSYRLWSLGELNLRSIIL
jgi:hypothetical protein